MLSQCVRKMREHLSSKSVDFAANFDVKQDAGGLVDIEFMTQAGNINSC